MVVAARFNLPRAFDKVGVGPFHGVRTQSAMLSFCTDVWELIKVALRLLRMHDDPADVVQVEIVRHALHWDIGDGPPERPTIPEIGEICEGVWATDKFPLRRIGVIRRHMSLVV